MADEKLSDEKLKFIDILFRHKDIIVSFLEVLAMPIKNGYGKKVINVFSEILKEHEDRKFRKSARINMAIDIAWKWIVRSFIVFFFAFLAWCWKAGKFPTP